MDCRNARSKISNMDGMSAMKRDYRDDLHIDKYDLDNELVLQPKLFMDWVEFEADADYLMNRAERRIKAVKAEVASEVRASPTKWGWTADKAPTEPFIKECVDKSKRVNDAYEDFFKKKRRAKILGNSLWAFTHRKESIGHLCGLHGRQYYARPYVEGGTDKEVKERLQRQGREQGEKALKQNERLKSIFKRRKEEQNGD